MKIEYLPANKDVIKTIAGWLFKEWGHLERSLERTIEDISERIESTVVPLTLVAFDQDRAIGTASLVINDMETHPQYGPWLASVYVIPEFRHNGIATALCKTIMSEMGRLKIEKAYLFTTNKEVMYGRLGWQTLERVPYQGEEVTVMTFNPRNF